MFQFLKKLYEQRHKLITIILLDDSKPGEDNSYEMRPNNLFVLITTVSITFAIGIVAIFMVTPLGALLYTKEDALMRAQVEDVTNRVISLQDSLQVRDEQLDDMKRIIRLSIDTTLAMDSRFSTLFESDQEIPVLNGFTENTESTSDRVSASGIVFSNILESVPDFPAPYPVQGPKTRDYDPDSYHFGIDIATTENEVFTSIADGTVVNASWTINDGYVISIQHAGGVLSIYKHCSSITKKSGDIVLKGDIVGTTGDVGIHSSGPHLHLEIWKDGLPQDPAMYLIQ
ncbi:MAG: M23 family metallopeptidase [Balneolales bacterium]|nr:M23 family metallopeptidase [Balneolales bacterium]